MNWPQITLIVLAAMSLGVAIAKHGDPRPAHSMWMTLIILAIEFFLLYKGGFFGVAA